MNGALIKTLQLIKQFIFTSDQLYNKLYLKVNATIKLFISQNSNYEICNIE